MKPFKNKEHERLHEQYIREIKLQGKSPKTIDSYARSLKRLLNYFDCHPKVVSDKPFGGGLCAIFTQ